MAAEGRVGRVREPLDEGAFLMTIEINGMAHVILTVSRFDLAFTGVELSAKTPSLVAP
jgi:hypothetical protein